MPPSTRTYIFEGFEIPTTTQTPDIIFDLFLPDLSGAELKVLLYIVRHTYGFKGKRDGDTISLSQLMHGITTKDGRIQDRGTGLSKKTLLKAINGLETMALIETERRLSADKGDEPTLYRLKMKKSSKEIVSDVTDPRDEHPLVSTDLADSTPPVGEKIHHGGGGESTPSPWGNNSPTQQTRKQQTVTSSNSKESKTIRNDGFGVVPPDVSPSPLLQARQESAPARSALNRAASDSPRGLSKVGTVLGQLAESAREARSDSLAGAPQMSQNRAARGQEAANNDLARKEVVAKSDGAPVPAADRSKKPARGRHPKIECLIAQASQELLDAGHLRSNITQGLNVFARCGLDESTFLDVAAQALALTRESVRAGTIRGSRMAYYFSVLRERTSLLVGRNRRAVHRLSAAP